MMASKKYLLVFFIFSLIAFLGLFIALDTSIFINNKISNSVYYTNSFNNTLNFTIVAGTVGLNQTNFTLGTGISLVFATNGSNALATTANSSNSIWWINNTGNLTNVGLNNSFWFNVSASADGGDYNLTITTLDNLGVENVTIINITVDTTWPTNINNGSGTPANNSIVNANSFLVNMTSADINFANITIRLYNSSLSVINNSFVNTTSSNYSVNFTGLSDLDGLYYYDALVYDLANNYNSSSLRQVILNVTFPFINTTSIALATTSAVVNFTSNKSVNATLAYGTTSAFGLNGTPITLFAYNGIFTLSSLANSTTYYYNLTICDRAGNCFVNGTNVFTTLAISVDEDSNSGPSGGTTSDWYSSYYPSIASMQSGYSVDLINKGRVVFKVNNESHQVGVVNINSSTGKVTINISSKTQQAVLIIGEEKKFDVNADNYYDLKILMSNITSSRAKLTLWTINEKIVANSANNVSDTSSENTGTTLSGDNSESSGGFSETTKKIIMGLIGVALVILVVFVAYVIYLRRKRIKMFGY